MTNTEKLALMDIVHKYHIDIEQRCSPLGVSSVTLEVSYNAEEFLTKLSHLDDKKGVEVHAKEIVVRPASTLVDKHCEKCGHYDIKSGYDFCNSWHNFTDPKGSCYKFNASDILKEDKPKIV